VSRPLAAALAAALLSTVGCLDVAPNVQTLDFFLSDAGIGDGWDVAAADYPIGREADVNVVGERRSLPASIGNGTTLYQSGTNVTNDLFVFQKKLWNGLIPGTYEVSFQIEFISNVHEGCTTGIGSGVVLKAGVSSEEPAVTTDAQSIYRVAINKGTGTSGGDFTQLGDIRNGLTGCPATGTYAINTTPKVKQATDLVVLAGGTFWMFLGTQSSALARHEVYLTRVSVSFSPK
jgi:hypothetical protein